MGFESLPLFLSTFPKTMLLLGVADQQLVDRFLFACLDCVHTAVVQKR